MITDTHPVLAQAAGALLGYLDDPAIREIRVTSAGRCFVIHSLHGKQRMPDMVPERLHPFLGVCASMVTSEFRASSPRLHAAFPALGMRVQAGRPPMSDNVWMVCRKHPRHAYTLGDFEAKGILTTHGLAPTGGRPEAHPTIRQTLEEAVRDGFTVVIAGAVGSAKTSLANALLDTLRLSEDRIVILEEDQELRAEAMDVQTIRTSESPPITMRDLAKDVLRMSPDRVVVGEVRDGAALDMLKAFQTGSPGLCTVHAPSARETLVRFEQLVQEVSMDRQQHLIGEAVDVIVHMSQYGTSWRVTDMIAVDGFHGGEYVTRSLIAQNGHEHQHKP